MAVRSHKRAAAHGASLPHQSSQARLAGLAFFILAIVVFGCARPVLAADAEAAYALKLTPQTVEMGAFYDGMRMRIEGTAPSKVGILVVIRGAEKDELFNKKGRVGFIWINTDKVHISGQPSLLLRFSSEDVHTLLGREAIDQYVLDEAAIRQHMHIKVKAGAPDRQYRELIENSYLQLKKKDGNYRKVSDRVQIAEAGGMSHYELSFTWPKTAPPGTYNVEVYFCRDGQVLGSTAAPLNVVEVGFPAFMAKLAQERPYLYGVLAILIAVLAGFGIDAIASRLRGKKKRIPVKLTPAEAGAKARAAHAAAGEEKEEEKFIHH